MNWPWDIITDHKKRKQVHVKDFEESDRSTMQPWLNMVEQVEQHKPLS